MAHACTTAYEQPLWIRHKAAVEEAEIHMGSKHSEVENGVARIGKAVPYSIARDDFMRRGAAEALSPRRASMIGLFSAGRLSSQARTGSVGVLTFMLRIYHTRLGTATP
jgi:hypothetical protein